MGNNYEDFGNTEDGYASDEEVESGLFDSGIDYDVVATGRVAERLTSVGRKVVRHVWESTSSGKVFNSDGRDTQAHPDSRHKDSGKRGVKKSKPSHDTLIQEEFDFIEGISAVAFEN